MYGDSEWLFLDLWRFINVPIIIISCLCTHVGAGHPLVLALSRLPQDRPRSHFVFMSVAMSTKSQPYLFCDYTFCRTVLFWSEQTTHTLSHPNTNTHQDSTHYDTLEL